MILAGGKLDKLPPAGDIGAARLVIPVIRGKNEAAVKLGAAPLKAPFEAGKAYDFANIGDVAGTVVVPKQPDGKDYAPPREFKVDVTRAVKAVAGGEPFHGFAIRTLQDRGVDEGVYTRIDIPTAAKIGLELDVYSTSAPAAAKP